jgi:hypothetical protein
MTICDIAHGQWGLTSSSQGFRAIVARHPKVAKANHVVHLGTLGTGNHFIEVCLDEADAVWFMLHSGSRGVGNRIGTYFIELAREDMRRHFINLPDRDLSYFPEGTTHFGRLRRGGGMGPGVRDGEPAADDGGAARSRRGRAHAEAGGLCQGLRWSSNAVTVVVDVSTTVPARG